MDVCCDDLKFHVEAKNQQGNSAILYISKFNEFAIRSIDNSYFVITNCPWCGLELPESKAAEWQNQLKKMGFDEPVVTFLKNPEIIPDQYKTDAWFRV